MNIIEIHDSKQKIEISTNILKALPNWFGIPESTQEYINKSSNLPFFAAIDESKPLECLPELWGKENPCLIMVQHIE